MIQPSRADRQHRSINHNALNTHTLQIVYLLWHLNCYFSQGKRGLIPLEGSRSQTKRINPNKIMKNLSKTMLAVLATGVLSCAVFSQQAQATAIEGNINLAGAVRFNTNSLATASSVVTWFDSFNNAGFSTVQAGGISLGCLRERKPPWRNLGHSTHLRRLRVYGVLVVLPSISFQRLS
jgi:hypothetical protein